MMAAEVTKSNLNMHQRSTPPPPTGPSKVYAFVKRQLVVSRHANLNI